MTLGAEVSGARSAAVDRLIRLMIYLISQTEEYSTKEKVD